MSNLLGVIKAVIGLVYVVEPDGSQRLLKEGDRIYSGEEIVTGDSGAVSVSLPDGKTLDLGRNSHWTEHGLNAVNTAEHDTQDVASLQKAITDGADPTQALEATAAGNEPPVQIEGGGGGHTLVQLELTGQVVDPNAGFNTKGIGAPEWDHRLPESGLNTGDTAGSPPVLPPLVHIDDFAGNDGYVNKNEINHANIDGTSNQNHVTLVFTDSQKNTLTIDVPVKNGHWTAQPDLSSLAEGNITVVATATDVSGRTAISTSEAQIDTIALHDNITIDSVTADNVINIAESHQAQTQIHGNVSGDAKIGDKVTLIVDGKEYTDAVIDLGDGKLGYQINVSTQGLLANPNVHATVTSTDAAGNTTEAHADHLVGIDLDVQNSVTIETVASDDIVNRNESRMPTMINGEVGGDAKAGDPITVTVQGQQFHGVVVNDNGHLRYEVPVPTSLLKEGANDIQVQVVSHDTAGNEAIAVEHRVVTLDTQAHNALTIETVAGDNTVNAIESRMPTFISGQVTGDAQVGDHVAVSVNGKEFYGEVTVDENGNLRYEVPVPTSALNEGSNDVQVMVTGVDASGNTAIAVEHKTVTLDTHAEATINIDNVTDDNVLNHAELDKAHQFVTGVVGGDARKGDVVDLDINGHKFTGHVVELADGTLGYRIPVDSTAFSNNQGEIDTDVKVTATVTSHDKAGNEVIQTTDHTVHIDNHANNHATINTVAGDNVVNKAETEGPTHITGFVNGPDAKAGDHVVVHVHGHDFKGEVVADAYGKLHYDVAVHTDLLKEGANDVQVTVTSHDSVGNEAIATEHKNVTLDTHAKATITINDVTDDNVLNHTELGKAHQLITGVVDGDARKGDVVHLDINGQHFKGHVIELADGTLGYRIPVDSTAFSDNKGEIDADVKFTATVTAHDKAGNEVNQVTEHTVRIDNHANNNVTISTIAGDNVVNKAETEGPTHITGFVNGPDAKAGDHVVVHVHGHDFKGEVVADARGKLHYDVAVHTDLLKEGANDVQVTVTSHDSVGNEAIATEHKNVTLDTHAKATITVDSVTDDNVLNHTELGKAHQLITGVVDGDARKGDVVHLDINGQHFKGHVIELADGTLGYRIPVDSTAFSDNKGEIDADVKFTATVTAHDKAGNEVNQTIEHTVRIDNHANNNVTISTVAGDNVVNKAETEGPTHITGFVNGPDAKAGDHVVVHVHGHDFKGEVVADARGKLHYDIAVHTDLLKEGANDVQVTVTSHDSVGNEAIATEHKNVTLDTHAKATITVDDVTHDNVLNHTELGNAQQFITGVVDGDARKGDVVDLNINGHKFTGNVVELADGTLGYSIPVDSTAFSDNKGEIDADVTFTATVTSHDKAQNEVIVTTEHTVHIDNHADNAITISTVAGDDIVSSKESQHDTIVSGFALGPDAKAGDPVVVTVNGQTFTGKVSYENGNLVYKVAVQNSALTDGKNDVKVEVTSHDKVGNQTTAEEHTTVTLDTHADASITVDRVTKDNTLTHAEMDEHKQLITGTVGGDAHKGDAVQLDINGHKYDGHVIEMGDGTLGYKISVDSSAFGDNHTRIDGNVKFSASVTSHDAVHNEVTVTTDHTVHIDNYATTALTIGDVASDNIVNMNESRMPTMISGEVSGDAKAGDPVVVAVNGQQFKGEVVGEPGHLYYNVAVPTSALNEGANNVAVSLTSHDALGNKATAVEHKTVTLDTHADATISLNDVTHDNVLNHSELDNPNQIITGTVGLDARVGDEVVLNFNGTHFSGTVKDLGNGQLGYQISVPSRVFIHNNNIEVDKDVKFTATVTSHDQAHNEAIVTTEHTVHIDNHANNEITATTVTDHGVVNLKESQHDTIVTGLVTGPDAKAGDPVQITVNGDTYTGKVTHENGNLVYKVGVPTSSLKEGDNDIKVEVTSHDKVGNQTTAVEHTHVTLDTHADASIHVDSVTHDNTLNYTELAAQKQVIQGTVGGDAQKGDAVSLNINGHIFTGKVIEMDDGKLGYKIPVDSKAFNNNSVNIQTDVKFTATVTSHDHAKNEVIAHTEHTVHIDNYAEAHITIDQVTGDDTINFKESGEQFTKVSGTVSGVDVHLGDEVIVTVNGHDYKTTVEALPHQNGALGYHVDVSTSDVLADPHHTVTAHITGQDKYENQQIAEESKDLTVDLKAEATITIDPVTANHDNMINGEESKNEFTTVTGTVGGDAKEGDLVTLHVNGFDLTAKVDAHLHYSINVSTYDLMADPHLTASITVTDKAQNVATQTTTQDIIVDTQVIAHISVDSVTDDNTLNGEELNHRYSLVTGKVSGEMHEGDPLTLKINGHDYLGKVELHSDGTMGYQVLVETRDIHADPTIHASISVTDAAGNHTVATDNHAVNIDDHADATVTINIVSGDDILNHHDQKLDTTNINGRVSGDVKSGDIVNVTVDGHVYHATVGPQSFLGGGLGYSIDVATKGLLHDPHVVATVDAKDAAGNTITAGATHEVARDDGATAKITIDHVTNDDFINNAEAHNPTTTITGRVFGDVHVGDPIELTVNGQHYFGQVISEGKGHGLGYSIDVSTDDLLSGGNKPIIHASITGYDAAGNTYLAQADHGVGIDTRADAHITVDSAVPEKDQGPDFIIVTGHVTGEDVHIGDTVHVILNGVNYDTHVVALPDGSLSYSKTLSAGDVRAHPDITVKIDSIDSHGNTITSVDTIHVHIPGDNTTTGTNGGTTDIPMTTFLHAELTISPVAGDNLINKIESQSQDTMIRGTVHGDHVHGGEKIEIHIGSHTYPGTVIELPNLPGEYGYAINVNTAELVNNPDISVTMPGYITAPTQTTVQIDTDVNATIHLDNIAGDNTINIVESQSGTTTVTGTVTGDGIHDGSNVKLMVNGHEITAQVHEDPNTHVKTFSKEVSIDDLRQDPNITASVTGHDKHGNEITVTDGKIVAVDTDVSAHVTIDPVTADNVLNLHETQQTNTTITGKVSGDVVKGDHVTISVNHHTYDATVDDHGGYKVDVQTSDLLADNKIVAQVTGHDDAQNHITVTESRTVTVDTTSSGTITINTVSGDNIISGHDLNSPLTEVSGVVGGDAKVGDRVKIVVNGNTTTALVEELPHMNGVLGYRGHVSTEDLHQDPNIQVSVKGEDSAHNVFEATEKKTLKVDDHADVHLHINKVSDDNVLNLDDSKKPTTEISGTVHGDVHAGNNVIVHVNGNDLNAEIKDDGHGNLTFSVAVNTADLLQDQHITYTVTGVDAVGNTVTISEDNKLTIDQVAKNSIHINTVASHDTVNFADLMTGKTAITGTVQGDAHAGDKVTLVINGQTYTGTVADSGDKQHHKLTYDIAVDNKDLHEGDNSVTVSVTGKDAAGNTATSTDSHTFKLDTHADASINMDPVASHNVINAKESAHVSVTGTVDGDAKSGDVVTLEVNGHAIHTTVVTVGNHLGYSVDVDKAFLQEGNNDFTVNVEATDAAGNTVRPAYYQNVVLDSHADATITVNAMTGDNTINASESAHISVSGVVDGDAKAGDVVTVEINGHTLTTTVKDIGGGHLGYDVDIKKGLMHEGHNDVKVSVDVTDAAQNHFTATQIHPVFVDTMIDASIHLNPVANHNVVNAQDPDQITVSGRVGHDVKLGDVVTLEVNHHTFTTNVVEIKGHLSYETQIEKSWLNEGDNALNVRVSTSDHAHNVTSASQTQNIHLDTHADAKVTINQVTGDNHIGSHELHHQHTHITGSVEGDVHDGSQITANVNGHEYDSVVHENNGHFTYDIPVDTSSLHTGANTVNVTVTAQDAHGNTTPNSNSIDVTVAAPHNQHHAGHHDSGLSNLFGDSDDSLSFNLHHDSSGHHGGAGFNMFNGAPDTPHDKIDLSDLAHELHEVADIAQLIKGGDAHGKADAAPQAGNPGHGAGHVMAEAPTSHDSHGSATYSLDHLIPKPEHFTH